MRGVKQPQRYSVDPSSMVEECVIELAEDVCKCEIRRTYESVSSEK